jgi:hypothetical protein
MYNPQGQPPHPPPPQEKFWVRTCCWTCAVTLNAVNTFEFVTGFGITACGQLVHFLGVLYEVNTTHALCGGDIRPSVCPVCPSVT